MLALPKTISLIDQKRAAMVLFKTKNQSIAMLNVADAVIETLDHIKTSIEAEMWEQTEIKEDHFKANQGLNSHDHKEV